MFVPNFICSPLMNCWDVRQTLPSTEQNRSFFSGATNKIILMLKVVAALNALFVQCFIHTGWLSFDYQYSPHTHPSMNHLSQSLSFSLSLVCVSLHFICLLCFRGLRSAVCLSAHFKHLLWLCFVCDKSDHQASLLPIDIPSTSDTRRLASIRQNTTGRWQHINIYFIYI